MTQSGVPLTPEQKTLLPGMLLPSGEENFFDQSQDRSYHDGSGIDVPFPRSGWADPSGFGGLLQTYPTDSGIATSGENYIGSGDIFNPYGLSGLFSNADPSLVLSGITDFTIFNPYIHYYSQQASPTAVSSGGLPVFIPYISDYTVSYPYDVYNTGNYAYYTYSQLFGNQ